MSAGGKSSKTEADIVKLDNIQLDKEVGTVRPDGTSGPASPKIDNVNLRDGASPSVDNIHNRPDALENGRLVQKIVDALKFDIVRLEDVAAEVVKSDNVRLDQPQDRKAKKKGNCDYGNSVLGGLRRLDQTAKAGNEKAAALLNRVLDPNDPLSVHAACVEMGWRSRKLAIDLDPKILKRLQVQADDCGETVAVFAARVLEDYLDGNWFLVPDDQQMSVQSQ